MSRKTLLCSAVVLAAAMTSAIAAEPVSAPGPLPEAAIVDYTMVFPAGEPRVPAADPSRLAEINQWIAENVDVPAASTLPNVVFVPAAEIASMRMRGLVSPHAASSNPAGPQTDTIAVYADKTQTIYLPAGWTGESAAELSVLVHEMVHHLQNQAKLRYECPQARERLAYAAQSLWLARSDLSLETEFEIDPFTLLVRTGCLG